MGTKDSCRALADDEAVDEDLPMQHHVYMDHVDHVGHRHHDALVVQPQDLKLENVELLLNWQLTRIVAYDIQSDWVEVQHHDQAGAHTET